MVMQQQKVKFYGGIVKRVFIVYQKDGVTTFNESRLAFVRKKFNSVRNYREFASSPVVETIEVTSDKLPRINTLKEGDACLLVGSGRLIDKASYEFASKCYEHGIPVAEKGHDGG